MGQDFVAARHDPSRVRSVQFPPDEDGWIDLARVVAAFAVVVLHVSAQYLYSVDVSRTAWIGVDIYDSAVRWCVPVFIMISGYLLLDPAKQISPLLFYRKRMARIGGALVAWTIIALIFKSQLVVETKGFSLMDAVTSVVEGKPFFHLWYLYMLVGLYLFCPFLKFATDQMTVRQLRGATILCFAYSIFAEGFNSVRWIDGSSIDSFPIYLGYFLAGHLFGRSRSSVPVMIMGGILVVSIIATVVGVYFGTKSFGLARGVHLYRYLMPNVVVMSLAAFSLLRQLAVPQAWRPLVKTVSADSFGIYLVHAFIIVSVFHWLPELNNENPLLMIPLLAVVSYFLSMGITEILRRVPFAKHIV